MYDDVLNTKMCYGPVYSNLYGNGQWSAIATGATGMPLCTIRQRCVKIRVSALLIFRMDWWDHNRSPTATPRGNIFDKMLVESNNTFQEHNSAPNSCFYSFSFKVEFVNGSTL